MEELGAAIWTIATVVGPIVLAILFVYGIVQLRRRRQRVAEQGREHEPGREIPPQ